ncbi:DMT family transporter [Salinibacillus aidingensis]|uniref:DMT family transporter n=1 Tax=Salinibacillus aidingensis TaxID=237684 RepID=A0ABN1B929_9BACI
MEEKSRWKGFVLVVLGALFWGVGGTVAQRLFQEDHIPVEWLVSVRLVIAGLIMIFIALFTNSRDRTFRIWTHKKAAIQLIIFGIFGMLAVQFTYMASINDGNAAVATLLQYLAPVYIIIYLVITKANRLKKNDLIAVCLAIIGTFLLLTNGSFQELSVPLSAVIWGFLSGIALMFYTLYANQLLQKWGSLNVIGWAMIVGGAALGLFYPPWNIDMSGWTVETVFFLIFVILFGTMFSFWFYLESLKYLYPQETSLLGSVEPLAAIVTSVVWLHIPFGIYQVMGTALILVMVVVVSMPEKKRTVHVVH